METPIRLIVGLGNPGADYSHTRHNAGADLLAKLAHTYQVTLSANAKLFGLCGNCVVDENTIRLLIPTTFMNRSGLAVSAVANFYKIQPESI